MMFKALGAATLLAVSSMAMAQSSTSGSSVSGGASGSADARVGAGAGGVDLTNKCVGMMGEEREKCLREQRSGASAGATTTTPATSPGIGTTTPAPLTTPGSPTNPTILPGSSTTPSGK